MKVKLMATTVLHPDTDTALLLVSFKMLGPMKEHIQKLGFELTEIDPEYEDLLKVKPFEVRDDH